jgi:flagellar hook-length control protein FliK
MAVQDVETESSVEMADVSNQVVLPALEDDQSGSYDVVEPENTAGNQEMLAPDQSVTEDVSLPLAETETAQSGQDAETAMSQSDKSEDQNTVAAAAADREQPVFPQAEVGMVKVGEAPAADQTEQEQPVEQQITEQLTKALDQGESKVEVHLQPSSLGDVTVEVTQQKDGSLHVLLTAENTHTQQLLNQHTDGLQALLSGQDQKTVQIDVQKQQQEQMQWNGQGNGNSQNGEQQQQQRQRQPEQTQDFLHQLRLGLTPIETETA